MPKIKIKATELVGTDVEFVSLVPRGANRVPFRITKRETNMLDMHKIARSAFAKTATAKDAVLVGAVLAKGADTARLGAMFKAAGLDPKTFHKSEDQDGTVAIKGVDAPDGEVSLLKLDDETVLVVSSLKKSFDSWAYNAIDFTTVLNTEGVYPMLYCAQDALSDVISNILYASLSPSDAATKVAAACDDFKNYVTTLLGAVPVQAFKMDKELAGERVAKAAKATEDDKKNTAVNASGSETTTGNGDLPDKTKKQDVPGLPDPTGFVPGNTDGFAAAPTDTSRAVAAGSEDDKKLNQDGGTTGSSIPNGDASIPGGVRKNEGDAAVGQPAQGNQLPEDQSGAGAQQPAPGQTAPVVLKEDAALSPVLAALADLRKSMDDRMDALNTSVASVTEQVDGLNSRVQKSEEALNGTAFATASGDAPQTVNKSAGSSVPPLLDTAFSRGQ